MDKQKLDELRKRAKERFGSPKARHLQEILMMNSVLRFMNVINQLEQEWT